MMENPMPWCGEACQQDCCRREEGALGDDGSVFRYCDGHLNFSTASQDDEDFYHKRKLARDPMSHRIIEKRRRDRMNNCLADLSRLIPADYLKKGRGRIEKTEIIEMAIKHMRHLQTTIATTRATGEADSSNCSTRQPIVTEHYRLGYLECLSEAMHFLVEIQGYFAGDALCVQLINHLHRHCDTILKGDTLNFPRQHHGDSTSSSSNSTTAGGSPPLGMSNSTGGHSDEQAEYPTCYSETDDSAFIHRNYSSSSGIESISIKEENEGPSQLRDMLTSHGRKSDSSSGFDTASEEHHMYKFKNTIQQRYNESRLHDGDEPPIKKSRMDEASLPGGRLSFGHKALAKPLALLTSPKASPDVKLPGIPIFALHASGAFYIPLTLDQHLLMPHLSSLTEKPPHKAVLHPVTISVNFQQQHQTQQQDVKP